VGLTDHIPPEHEEDDKQLPPAGEIPEVFPDAHIAPEFPEQAADAEQPAAELPQPPSRSIRTSRSVQEPPQFITPSTRASAPPTHRSRRVKSARPSAPAARYTLVTVASAFRSVSVTFAAAVIVATVFMWWTSPDFLPRRAREEIAKVQVQVTAQRVSATRTPVPTQIWANRIGIIAGHLGNKSVDGVPDPGAVCEDNEEFYEAKVTLAVAERVVAMLRGRGFDVDLLEEFDSRLTGYQAAAMVSLHADSCEPLGFGGFKNAFPEIREVIREQDLRLDECIRQNYQAVTALDFLPAQITANMTNYHAFRAIAPTTPANILELGLLYDDRQLLFGNPDLMALGVYNGIICFLDPKLLLTPTVAPPVVQNADVTVTPGSTALSEPAFVPTVTP
jgi:N-acetylmuramoyl-L-alanine amidase